MADETLPNKNEHMVLAYYATVEAAEQALDAVRKWDAADKNVTLGHSGILVKKDGKVKALETGRRTGAGVAAGIGIGLLGVLTGGIGLLGALVGGGAVGGVVGSLFKRSLGLTPEDMQEISERLDAGGAAVVVMADEYEIDGVVADLKQNGGTVERYDISSALLPDVQNAVDSATAAATGAEAAVVGAATETADAVKDAADKTADETVKVAKETGDVAGDAAKAAGDAVADASKKTGDAVADASKKTGDAVADAAKSAGDAAADTLKS